MGSFSLAGQRLAYTVHGEGPRLTILLHGLNNFAATVQTFWLAGQ